MSKLTAQQKVNALSASIIGLCEVLEQFFELSGVLIPEVKKRLDNTQELCYQLCPEKEQRDFALCYAAVSGNTIDNPEQTLEETALVETSG